jgi:DNA adenine methylase
MKGEDDMILQPFTYMGGKYYIAKAILKVIPPHRVWVEPFCGSAVVTLSKPPSKVEVINDLYGEIPHFFRTLRERTEEVVRYLELLPYSEQEYRERLAAFLSWRRTGQYPLDPVERAVTWFYLNAASFDSMIGRGFSAGAVRNPARDLTLHSSKLRLVARRLREVQILCRDFEEVLRLFMVDEECCAYIDPPYLGVGRRKGDESYYGMGMRFSLEDHIRLSKCLSELPGKFILSYYPHPLLEELYPRGKWRYVQIRVAKYSQNARTKGRAGKVRGKDRATELLILNYDTGLFRDLPPWPEGEDWEEDGETGPGHGPSAHGDLTDHKGCGIYESVDTQAR